MSTAPPADATGKDRRWLTEGFTLSGADLYRINCRSCHRAGGEGLPPEINPILDPVRAASPEKLEEQMARRGRKLRPELAEQMAKRAEVALRHRLSEGGEVMAPFAHLDAEEVDTLLSYLDFLAGVSKTPPSEPPLRQGAARVGEHVVKAICHVCHDARRIRRPGYDFELPALDEITDRYSIAEVVRKVRTGVVVEDARQNRGRMPRFSYLRETEIEAAYAYLAAFPPTEEAP